MFRCYSVDPQHYGLSFVLETPPHPFLFLYLRAILCTFQISVDFYYVPVGTCDFFLTFYFWKIMLMYLQKVISIKTVKKLFCCWRLEGQWRNGSGSISQRHGSEDPDPDPGPRQTVTDLHHRPGESNFSFGIFSNCSENQPSHWFWGSLKGTVRPDWICMRVVSLKSPLKAHKPL